jgi:hypothetical protein
MLNVKVEPYLSGDTGRDYNDLHTVKSLIEFVCGVTVDLAHVSQKYNIRAKAKIPTSPGVSMWLTSAATPGAPRISYRLREVTSGSALSKRERG